MLEPSNSPGIMTAQSMEKHPIFFPAAMLALIAPLLIICSIMIQPKPALILRSEPSGATVYLNGKLLGPTPVRVGKLPPGAYALRMEKEGYAPFVQTVEFHSTIVLQKIFPRQESGSLTVDVKPCQAEVLLDGELLGYTPLHLNRVPAGLHELLIRKTNYSSYVQQISVAAGQHFEFKNFELHDKLLAMLERAVECEKVGRRFAVADAAGSTEHLGKPFQSCKARALDGGRVSLKAVQKHRPYPALCQQRHGA